MNPVNTNSGIDALLDRAFEAIGRGERTTANVLAERVLAIDRGNADAEDLLTAPADHGEIRRLTIMFVDLVDSTALSTRTEPEIYRAVVGRYKERVRQIVDRYEAHIASTKGDGMLIMFGHPKAHENDVQRAVHAGLDIAREVEALSQKVLQRFGFSIQVRVGVHRGVVYLDLEQDDVYGLAANLAARVSGLAPPDAVVVSAAVEALTRGQFEFEPREAKAVKGVLEPVDHFVVLGERAEASRTKSGTLVGRGKELAQIHRIWAEVSSGDGDTVGLGFYGEAGIGKSRMAAAAAELAEQSGAVVLELRGSPLHADVGLHPVRRLLERRSGIQSTTPAEARIAMLSAELEARGLDPSTNVPLLAPVLAIDPKAGYQPAELDGSVLFRRISEAVQKYLLACCGQGPALVIAEDMHWFDEDSAEIVQALLTGDSGRRLVLMTSRERAALPDRARFDHVSLGPLSDDDTDDLIAALHPELGAHARTAVRTRCDGMPLFVEEVVAKLKQESAETSEPGRVPDSLYEALFARLRSSRDAVRVVEAAAVIGSHVDRRSLGAVAEIDESELDQAIAELCAGRVLEPEGEDTWRFRHELLREVATELSPPSLLRRLHGRAAEVLLSRVSDANSDWPLIAGHFEKAQQHEAATSAYQKASGAARRRGALLEARAYLSHAIAQCDHLPAGPERDRREISLRLRRGFLYYAAEGAASVNAAADFERCLHLRATEAGEDLLAILTALYGHYAIRADLNRAHQVVKAIEAAVVNGDPDSWPTVTAGLGMVDWYRGDFLSARKKLEWAAVRRDNVRRQVITHWFMANEPIASIHTHLALARFIHGDLAGAEEQLLNSARRCEAVGLPQGPFSRAYARQTEVLIRIESGDLHRAAEVCAELVSDARKNNLDSWVDLGRAQQAVVAALLDIATPAVDRSRLSVHIATVTALVDAWRAAGLNSLITFYDGVLARLHLAAGAPDEARRRVDIGLSLAAETDMHFYDAELFRIRAHTHDDIGRRSEGLCESIELARNQHAAIFELRSAADYFELFGEQGRQELLDAAARFSDQSTWPELARATSLLG